MTKPEKTNQKNTKKPLSVHLIQWKSLSTAGRTMLPLRNAPLENQTWEKR